MGERKGGLLQLIDGYKFRYQRVAAAVLAGLLADITPRTGVLVPIPTSRAHRRQRGYDHTYELVKVLARRTGLSVLCALTTSSTVTQHFSSRQERYKQAESLFTAGTKLDSNETYLLVDDIITTGSTMLAAARALRRAGARNIEALVIARQPLD